MVLRDSQSEITSHIYADLDKVGELNLLEHQLQFGYYLTNDDGKGTNFEIDPKVG